MNIRGLGAPMRMMCEYAGVEYKDNQYDSVASWHGSAKATLIPKNPLMNLPHVIDGDVCVTQSVACFLYLGQKLGLDSKDTLSKEYLSNLQITAEADELRNAMIALVYPFAGVTLTTEDFEKNKGPHLEKKCTASYTKLENWLAQSGTTFFSGSASCSADFHVWEMIDQHSKLAASFGAADPLEKFPKLKAFEAAFSALPQLAKYFASDAAKLPINNVLGNCHFK